jgi:hypothetical protein
MNWPGEGDGQGEHSADCGLLDHRAEGLIIVDAESLGEAVNNPTSLVPVQGAIGIEHELENPLVGDDAEANGVRDKIPGVVSDQGNKLFFHSTVPVRIGEGSVDRGGYQQQGWRRGGRHRESISRKPETPLLPHGHQMRIDQRCHQYGLHRLWLLIERRCQWLSCSLRATQIVERVGLQSRGWCGRSRRRQVREWRG